MMELEKVDVFCLFRGPTRTVAKLEVQEQNSSSFIIRQMERETGDVIVTERFLGNVPHGWSDESETDICSIFRPEMVVILPC